MEDVDSTRRTALKLLGVGAAATTGTGLAVAGDRDDDHDDRADDRKKAGRRPLYVAELGPQADVESKARGEAAFQFRNEAPTFALAVANIENTFMAHVHEDEALGPIAVWLHDFRTQDEELVAGRFTGLLDAGTITDAVIHEGRVHEAESKTVHDLVEKLDAGEAYVNVHTEDDPGGEIAGKIERFDWSDLPTDRVEEYHG